MIKLDIPKFTEDAAQIFEGCVNAYNDSKKKSRLLAYKKDVKNSCDDYKKYIPQDIEHYPTKEVNPADVTLLNGVYDNNFVAKTTLRNKYYDTIMAKAGGKCAICSTGVADTLDHYLPKTLYPLLCVYPTNLVPECFSCNHSKGTFFEASKEKMLIHPYIDDLSGVLWLKVNLKFNSQISIEYVSSYPPDTIIESRIKFTMGKYKLPLLFATQANSEINNNIKLWRKILEETGEGDLKEYFKSCRESREQVDNNSWQSALYRALEIQSSEVTQWIRDN